MIKKSFREFLKLKYIYTILLIVGGFAFLLSNPLDLFIVVALPLSLLYKGRGEQWCPLLKCLFCPPSHSKLQFHLQIKGDFKQKYQKYNYNNHS